MKKIVGLFLVGLIGCRSPEATYDNVDRMEITLISRNQGITKQEKHVLLFTKPTDVVIVKEDE